MNQRVEEDSILVIHVLLNIRIEAVWQSYQDGRFSFVEICLGKWAPLRSLTLKPGLGDKYQEDVTHKKLSSNRNNFSDTLTEL